MTAALPSRRFAALTLAALAGVLAVPAVARAAPLRDAEAERFVEVEGGRLVAILADRTRSPSERVASFRAAVDRVADVPRITRFVLGKYARSITPDQMRRFAPAFRDYAQDVYQHQLADFSGRALQVTGSLVRKPGDVVVTTLITGGAQPGEVAWRVMGSGADWKVVDVQVSGVWLAITQQQDFVSTIDNHGGHIDALIAQLQAQTHSLSPPAASR